MPFCLPLSALTIAILYYSWRDGYYFRLLRNQRMHERVAYLLWTTAHHAA